jgi:signal transduction protein with GAF and PtsI domain
VGDSQDLQARIKQLEDELEQKSRDIASITRAHALLSKRTRIFERVHALFEAPERIEENLSRVLEVLGAEFDCEAGAVLLIDGEAREFFFSAAFGPNAERLSGMRFSVEKGLAGACAQSREPLVVSNVADDPRFFRGISESVGFEVRNLLALPMRDGLGVSGVIELLNKRSGPDYRSDEIDTGLRVADLAARLVAVGVELEGGTV